MKLNFPILFAAAVVPLLVGFIWYNRKTFGNAWMKASGMTEEKAKGMNMGIVFGLTYLFSFFVAFALQFIVIHQYSTIAILSTQPDSQTPGSESMNMLNHFMELYGHSYRTFKHGAFHGTIAAITLALPVLGVNALFERKGGKYIFINLGFWIVCMALMGGIICQWS